MDYNSNTNNSTNSLARQEAESGTLKTFENIDELIASLQDEEKNQ
ncbi:hypothetical protein C5L30_000137 [Companilactobacillus farciminis]|uniref:Uncharacterized protein n=1 Tax=Companilactobacillus farciminis TaxID=1612 RepID=A0A4R5NJV3_9LACO|nr:hypothetical protein [Companilactobacillus farciminis]TDG74902.1 hypothetical protein C5L30_000137 [Companilactobacillus farciminis]